MEEIKGKTIVCYFSCGVASAIALAETKRRYGKDNTIVAVNNFIFDENEDNRRFLKDVEKWLDITIQDARNPKYINASCEEVWTDRRYMSGTKGAPCTQELKKNARQYWESLNHWDYLVMGFTYEEKDRHERFKLTERENIIPVLIDAGLTHKDCEELVIAAGIKIPLMYRLGFNNANCVGCVKSSSPAYWNLVRKHFPDVFEARAKLSRYLGCRLIEIHPKYVPWCSFIDGKWVDNRDRIDLYTVSKKTGKQKLKKFRIFLDELPEDLQIGDLGASIECGIFCEEKQLKLKL